MSLFLQYGYVPNPLRIYRGFAQLEPGHFVRLAFDAAPGQMPQSRPYWDLPEPKPEPADPEEAEETLDRLLRDVTRLRMRADVPMGAFLSGGIDLDGRRPDAGAVVRPRADLFDRLQRGGL